MKTTRSIAIVVLLSIMIMSLLSACSGNGDNKPGSSDTPQANEGESGSKDAQVADPLGKFDPPIEVTVIRPYDENTKFVEGDSAEDNEWTRAYAERLGINVKFKWTLQGGGYTEKLNVSIASDDLADIMVVNSSQLNQMAEAGQLADLKESFDLQATEFVKEQFNADGGISLKSATFDGKLLGIPRIGSDIDEVPLLWVRMDWLKKLNLPEPKTIADVLAISKAFTNNDPDGNNKADTYGMALSKDLNGGFPGFEGFLNGYHAQFNMWIKDESGQIVNSNIQPEMKTALAELQRMYKDKEIDREFGTKDGNKVAEQVTSGKIGMYYGLMWTPLWPLQGGKDLDPGMEWKSFPLPSIDGTQAKAQIPFPVGQYYVVRKDAAHPEAAVKMLNLFFDTSFDKGTELDTYGTTPDGIEAFKHAIIAGAPMTSNMDKYKQISYALDNNNDLSQMKDYIKTDFAAVKSYLDGDPKGWGMYNVFGKGSSFSVIEKYVAEDVLLRSEFFGAPTPTMVEKNSTLESLLKETFTKIIMGGASIDEFDKFTKNWKKLGGDQITKEVNEWYAKQD
ncbi:extracellular solute-binding protein [Paenibacillus nasutitermitis]|uniref:Sugar ABC transporter substrate-binding protein n=1 Tax=Paenibacillus nasutitermitis TaxID=1652958 RepID=A0A917DYW9_9BACL|nr:extracellular solute-binding protein [Paenibacillus nasutitermitis]GGD85375.1 sugar ABC transporter substrate-binding protein [Paenibacillus nasutitermitis]